MTKVTEIESIGELMVLVVNALRELDMQGSLSVETFTRLKYYEQLMQGKNIDATD